MSKRIRLFVIAGTALALILGAIVFLGVSDTRAKQEMDARLQALQRAAVAGTAGRAVCENVAAQVEQDLRSLESEEGSSERVRKGYRALGDCQLSLGRSKLAIDAYAKVVSFTPEAGRAHGDLARAYARNRDHTNAVRHARLAVQLSPTQWQAHRILARMLESTGQLNEALASMRKAAALAPADQQAAARNALARLEAKVAGSTSIIAAEGDLDD